MSDHVGPRALVVRLLSLLVVASVACNALGAIPPAEQTREPTASDYATSLPHPTPSLPRIDLTPIATGEVLQPDGMLTDTQISDSSGEVVIEDANARVRVTIEVLSTSEGQPAPNIEINWISVGDEFVIFTVDPRANFLPAFRTGSYSEEVGRRGLSHKVSFGGVQAQVDWEDVKIALKLAKIVSTIKSIEDLAEYLASWSHIVDQPGPYGVYNDFCMTGAEIHDLFSAGTLILPLGGQLAAEGAELMIAAILAVSQQIFEERAEEILNSVEGKHNFRLYTTPLPFPVFTYLGRCDDLDGGDPEEGSIPAKLSQPDTLDRKDSWSVIQWIEYALQTNDISVFDLLATEEVVYAKGIEGSQPVAKDELLNQLSNRWSSGPYCEAYALEGGALRIWTEGWSPPWEMTELCYDGCQDLQPPWQSDTAAFFLSETSQGWAIEAIWLNARSFWQDLYGTTFNDCDQEPLVVSLEPEPSTSAEPTVVISIANIYDSKMVLEDGTECRFMGGATRSFGGDRMNYLCSNGWFILGDPTKGDIWEIRSARLSSDTSSILEEIQVKIETIWFWD